jgi:hypothetical protein
MTWITLAIAGTFIAFAATVAIWMLVLKADERNRSLDEIVRWLPTLAGQRQHEIDQRRKLPIKVPPYRDG